MSSDFIIIDIETAPLNFELYFSLVEEERLKMLNPIDSKIIAIGIRHNSENYIFSGNDEKKILEDFWSELSSMRKGDDSVKIVGFNIADFDMSFLTTRSFINGVAISPFKLKNLVDLREKISAYRHKPKGRLRDFAKILGITHMNGDGKDIAELARNGDMISIQKHLEGDLITTEELLKRANELNITKTERW